MSRNLSARVGSINCYGDCFLHEPVPSVSVDQLHEYCSSGKDFYLLDVRKSDEYEAGHVPFVDKNIPGDNLEQFLHILPLDRYTNILSTPGKDPYPPKREKGVIISSLIYKENFKHMGISNSLFSKSSSRLENEDSTPFSGLLCYSCLFTGFKMFCFNCRKSSRFDYYINGLGSISKTVMVNRGGSPYTVV